MRIGFGYDVHRLEVGYDLVIGGVEIPFDKGSVAHSDGDVLIHAICDALLGAANMGDIGKHFPDTDPVYKNIASTSLLEKTIQRIHEQGFRVANIDSTVCLQQPKLSPYIDKMKEILTLLIKCPDLSVKATTTEGMGFVGEGKGIAAYAVALIQQ